MWERARAVDGLTRQLGQVWWGVPAQDQVITGTAPGFGVPELPGLESFVFDFPNRSATENGTLGMVSQRGILACSSHGEVSSAA